MKKLTYLISFLFLISFGCKESINEVNSFQKIIQRSLIPLPLTAAISITPSYSVTDSIDGGLGGIIVINHGYLPNSGDSVIVSAVLKIPKGAFEGTKGITLTLDNHYATVYFDPHMTFNIPLNLNLTFKGLDLKGLNIDPDNIDFSYIDSDGNITHVDYNTLNVNMSAGLISMTGGKIDHFSRYGFSR